MINPLATGRCGACSARRPAGALRLPTQSHEAPYAVPDWAYADSKSDAGDGDACAAPSADTDSDNDEEDKDSDDESYAITHKLEGAGLGGYVTAFRDAGYCTPAHFDGVDEAALRRAAVSCGMSKPGHVMRLVKLFARPNPGVVTGGAARSFKAPTTTSRKRPRTPVATARTAPAATAPVVTVAEGYELLTSSTNASGYKHVTQKKSDGKYIAEVRRAGMQRFISSYATAVEAAVAASKTIEAFDRATEAAAACEGGPQHGSQVVRSAQGYRLHLSSHNPTGYKGVYSSAPDCSRPFFAKRKVVGGPQTYLGSFHTAARAAVAYAQHVAGDEVVPEEDEERRPLLRDTPMPVAPVVTHAQGLQLHLSSKSATGYLGVCWYKNRFAANHFAPVKQQKYIGRFKTAVEAAVAFAKYELSLPTSQRKAP